jgi:hypothetical protein
MRQFLTYPGTFFAVPTVTTRHIVLESSFLVVLLFHFSSAQSLLLSSDALAEIQYSCYNNIAATYKLTGLSNILGSLKTRKKLASPKVCFIIPNRTLTHN